MNKFICNECGYILKTKEDYSEIADNFTCPQCGADKNQLIQTIIDL